MNARHCRIGKVALKGGGAELRILHQATPDPGSENWRGKIVSAARDIAGYSEADSDLVGYFVVGFFSDGAHSLGFRYDSTRSPIPRRLMPAYLAELIREDAVTGQKADDVAVGVYNRTVFGEET